MGGGTDFEMLNVRQPRRFPSNMVKVGEHKTFRNNCSESHSRLKLSHAENFDGIILIKQLF